MTYDVPIRPGESLDVISQAAEDSVWPLWEVFVRADRGLSHLHIGSLHAPDAVTALENARDVYTRRGEGVSIWVVESDQIHAFDPDAAEAYVEANEKVYRLAAMYDIPDEVGHM